MDVSVVRGGENQNKNLLARHVCHGLRKCAICLLRGRISKRCTSLHWHSLARCVQYLIPTGGQPALASSLTSQTATTPRQGERPPGPVKRRTMDTNWNAPPLARGACSQGDTSPTNVPTPRLRKGFATASQGGISEGPQTGPRMEPDRNDA